MPPVTAEQLAALEHDYRFGSDRRRPEGTRASGAGALWAIVLLAYELDPRRQIARVVRCSATTVRRTLSLWAHGGRSALVRRPSLAHVARRTLAWQKELARAMDAGPEACGVPRPAWSAPLLARHLAQVTGVEVSERTVRRGLASLGYRL